MLPKAHTDQELVQVKIFLSASGIFGERQAMEVLIQMISNKYIVKVLLFISSPQYQHGDRIWTKDIHSICQD